MKPNISLEQLIPHPHSLRLLILHTPFPLALDPLLKCVNLIKLDVSNNAIQKVPYLGGLYNLRFLFLHNNKIDHENLKQIFELKSQEKLTHRSPLSLNLVWLTYWGNRNQFYARHYLVNNTNVAVVDKNIVVDQQKCQGLCNGIEPFSEKTRVEFPLIKLQSKSNGFTEEQYISYFYQELHLIRQLQIQTSLVLRIQKFWRGYKVRSLMKRERDHQKNKREKILKVVRHWIQFTKKKLRLKQILKKRQKEYLLFDIKNYKRILIYKKLIQLAHQAKQRVKNRNKLLKNQQLIYKIFKTNYSQFKQLYKYMKLDIYNCLYIKSEDFIVFEKVILPFVRKFNPYVNSINISSQNQLILMREGADSYSKIPFVHIMSFSIRSEMVYVKEVQSSKRKRLFDNINVKPVDKKVYFSRSQMQKILKMKKLLDKMSHTESQQLMIINNQPRVLMDICRGIYLFNRKIIGQQLKYSKKVIVIPKSIAVIVNSALKIQKIWKGYKVRKEGKKKFLNQILEQRAAIKIQRWFRKLPWLHRNNFLFKTRYLLSKFTDRKFFIPMNHYLRLKEYLSQKNYSFIQQYASIYYQRTSKSITLKWDTPENCPSYYSQAIQVNKMIQKPIFSKSIQQNLQIEIPNLINTQKGDLFHVLHFQCSTKIVFFGQSKFLMVECDSIQEIKLRVLAILLLTYRFQSNDQIRILNSAHMEIYGKVFHKQIIDNTFSTFIFTDTHVNYFKRQLEKLQYPFNKQEIMIYLKQTRNSFPFKVSEIMHYTISTSMYIKQYKSQQIKHIKEQIRPFPIFKKHNLNMIAAQTTKQNLSKSEKQKFKTKIIASVQRLKQQQKIKPHSINQSKRNLNKMKAASVYTKQKTQQSMKQLLPERPKRQKRFLTEVSIQGPFTNLEKKKQNQMDQTFVKNFINISNFLSKQYQKSHIRKKHKALVTELNETVMELRQQQKKSTTKVKRNKYLKEKFIRDNHKQYAYQVQNQLSQVRQKQQVIQRQNSASKRKSKIHIVFPQECYPLFPALS